MGANHCRVEKLGNLATKIGSGSTPKGGSASYHSSGVPLIRSQNVLWGKLSLDDVAFIDDAQHSKMSGSRVEENDVLLNITGASIGRAALSNIGDANVNQHVCIIRPKPELDNEYLMHFLISRAGQKQIDQLQAGGNRQGLNFEQIRSFDIPLPELEKQREIAATLSTWDRAIELHDKLIALKEKQKQGLMQVLLTGKKRLLDDNGVPFNGKWEDRKISDFIVESKIAGSNGSVAKKITVKLYGNGVFAKNESRAGSESTRYFKRRAGQFIYSKLDFLNGAFGIIPSSLDGFESTADLPAFDFKDSVDGRWFLSLISRDVFYKSQLDLASGGRKARRVNPPDFLAITIQTPPASEQTKIADTLCMADKEIAALKRKRELLNQQKQGLMQQLLG